MSNEDIEFLNHLEDMFNDANYNPTNTLLSNEGFEASDPQYLEKLKNQELIRAFAKNYNVPGMEYQKWIDQLINEGRKVSFPGKEKKNLIANFLKKKLKEKSGIEINNLPWDFLKEHNFSGLKDVQSFDKLTTKQLNNILKHLDETNISENFIPAKSSISNVISSTRIFILGLLKKVTGDYSATHIPWDHITKDDLVGWPPEIEVKDPQSLGRKEQRIILTKKDQIRFKQAFKAKYDQLLISDVEANLNEEDIDFLNLKYYQMFA